MKRIYLIILILSFCLTGVGFCQYSISSIKAGTGKGFITSGFDVTLSLNKSGVKNTLYFQANNDRIYAYYKFHSTFNVTGGIYKGAPWIGPYIEYGIGKISFVHWWGWLGGDSDKPQFVPQLFFVDNWVTVSIGKFNILVMLQHIKKNIPQRVVGLTYSQPIIKSKLSSFTSIQYDVGHGKYPLLFSGLNYQF